VFVHVGVHPCFCGGFADRSDPDAVVIRPGYLDAGLTLERFSDGGTPTPVVLAARGTQTRMTPCVQVS
jgi:hypothetical protein